ncbi:MAG: carbohydrate binding family 9 domain-containing protein [Gemmatimonadaceae bacterium]|nr:carbohydrate binding family 9 domain-containing protein [Gemmatimonadaceae bacterium]
MSTIFFLPRALRALPKRLLLAAGSAIVALAVLAQLAAAQQPTAASVASATEADRRTAIPLTRLRGPVTIDGRGDDPAWASVSPLPLTVYLPTHRAAPTESTTVRVAYDDDAVYVAMDAWEAHPGGVRASTMIRDDDAPGDFFNILFDTFADGQNVLGFATTPGGNRNDYTIVNDAQSFGSFSGAWNDVWDLATRRDAQGWHAEFRIPFSTLRLPTSTQRAEFGLSLNRLTAHSNERVTFPDIEPSAATAVFKASRMQRVSVTNISPGRGVRLTPYTIAGVDGANAPSPAASRWGRHDRVDMGGDLKVALTPKLTLDLTANTDFAEAEVDDERINLTRFPLFFPERRPFFLERAGTFEVRTGESDLLFNSRRVGLCAAGEPVRLLGGARLVGRVGEWDVGMFDAHTGASRGGIRDNLGVLRVRRGTRSWVGAMVTSRVSSDSSQAALGADGELALGGDDYLSFGAATLAGIVSAGVDGGLLPRSALRVLVERRRNRGAWYRAALSSTGARYAPALGYVERTNVLRGAGEVGYGRVVSSAGHLVRGSIGGAWFARNAESRFEGSTAQGALSLDLPSGGSMALALARQDDDLLRPFSPTPHSSVSVGRYAAHYAQASWSPPSGPRTVVGASMRAGQFYDGTLLSLAVTPEWRASAFLRVSGDVQLAHITFGTRGESEWSRLARLKVLASATPQLSLSGVVQANDLAHHVTANLRMRYNLREGHDLWVVYGHDMNLDRDRDRALIGLPAIAHVGLLVKYARSMGI